MAIETVISIIENTVTGSEEVAVVRMSFAELLAAARP